jgi:phosphoglycolate phosphatase-like HAD superfamily hydrolase
VRFRAVFFDVGETLVHPRPSFPELFARIVEAAGHARDPDAVLAASAAVRRGFSEASREGRRWTLTPEDSRAFWLDVYDQMLEELGMARGDGLRETLYEGFTDLGNYELFDDVPPIRHAKAGCAVGPAWKCGLRCRVQPSRAAAWWAMWSAMKVAMKK